MEKSVFRILIFLCVFQYSFAQDSLCVFHIKGKIYLQSSTNSKALFKGDLLTKKDKLKILPESELTAIDNRGNVYIRNKQGTCNFNDLLLSKQEDANTSLTAKYFKYIWHEFLNKGRNETIIAGVFRGNELMTVPKDSSLIASENIFFKWVKTDADLYYLFVLNTHTEELLKIETHDSQITLSNENPIFLEGDEFKWSISKKAFPNLKNMPYYTFRRISMNHYLDLKSDYNDLIITLNQIGISQNEIDLILCETYGLCN
jgi:hypothetical protein